MVIGVVLLIVAVARLVRPAKSGGTHRTPRVTNVALLGAGAGYVVSLLLDPTFLAVTVLAGRTGQPVEVVVMQAIWVLISQIPLLVLLVAVARVGQQRAVDQFQSWWSRAKPFTLKLVAVALIVVGVVLAVDAAWWFATGHFLLPASLLRI